MRFLDLVLVKFLFIGYLTLCAFNTDTGSSGSGIQEIPAWTSELHYNEKSPDILYENQVFAYHDVEVEYETFKLVYNNDFNMNYKFINDYKDNSGMNFFRVVRLITTLT